MFLVTNIDIDEMSIFATVIEYVVVTLLYHVRDRQDWCYFQFSVTLIDINILQNLTLHCYNILGFISDGGMLLSLKFIS